MKAKHYKRKRIRTVTIPKREEDGRRIIDLHAEKASRERAAFDETKERRMVMHHVDDKFARSQECGHVIGRLARQLKWNDEVAGRRIAAGFKFAEIITEYRKDVLASPNPNPAAMDMNKIGGLSTREVNAERIKRLSNDYMAIFGALGQAGPASYLFRLLDMTCNEDATTDNWPPHQIRDLIKALDAVAEC